jgi:hypothetical protein
VLPQLEKEHDHSRVATEALERRLLAHLSASAFTAPALLGWQIRGRGHPSHLGKPPRA